MKEYVSRAFLLLPHCTTDKGLNLWLQIEIIPDPAFVVKTKGADGKKIFINVCQSEHVKGLSKKVQIDDQNTEQEVSRANNGRLGLLFTVSSFPELTIATL